MALDTMLLFAIVAAATAAPIPMVKHLGCEEITRSFDERTCTALLTVAGPTGATVPLCCDVSGPHAPSNDLYYVPTTAMDRKYIPGLCAFIVTYSPLNAAWCALARPAGGGYFGVFDDLDYFGV